MKRFKAPSQRTCKALRTIANWSLLASLLWCACNPLKGTDCGQSGDCQRPDICIQGWCMPPSKAQPIVACPSRSTASVKTPELLSKDHEELGQAASDGRYLYWTDRKRGHLSKQPIDGGEYKLLHEDLGAVYGILLDGNQLYLTIRGLPGQSQGAILQTTTEGGPIKHLAQDIPTARQLAHNKRYLFWNVVGSYAKEPGGNVMMMPKDGSTAPKQLLKDQRPFAIAADDTHLYWIASHENGALKRIALDQKSNIEIIVPDLAYARDLVLDETHIYYLADGLHSIPKRGGTQPTRLSPDLSGTALAIDKYFAYVATGNGLRQIPLHCERFVTAFTTPTPGIIHAIANDPRYIFMLLRSDGVATTEIFRAAKRPTNQWKPN